MTDTLAAIARLRTARAAAAAAVRASSTRSDTVSSVMIEALTPVRIQR